MRCPYCKKDDDKVVDSRSAANGGVIRRRRQCNLCGKRFTTYEKLDEIPIRVVKKDGNRVPFDREKIINGLIKACEKRPISNEQLELVTERIEQNVIDSLDKEVTTREIGNWVMDELKKLDKVAYVRFASVYREFKDTDDFKLEVKKLEEADRRKIKRLTEEGRKD